jgi:fluoroquinolone transport system permease protein
MLYAILAAPILAGFFFRFGIPQVEILLCDYFDRSAILSEYYLLFDLLLATLTPFMFCFASAMVMLTEMDENVVRYIAVTPVGKRGYLLSRLLLPAGISILVSIVILRFFSLTDLSLTIQIITCILTGILSIAVCLFILSFSHNRVEGMALGKLTGTIMLGLPVPFFLFTDMQYAVFFLPSFWIAKLGIEKNLIFAIPAGLISALWIWLLYGRFKRRIL